MSSETLGKEYHYSVISQRELEILRLKGQGKTHNEIEEILNIPPDTLKNLLYSRWKSRNGSSGLYEKLGLAAKKKYSEKDLTGHSGTAAVIRAVAFGLLKVKDF